MAVVGRVGRAQTLASAMSGWKAADEAIGEVLVGAEILISENPSEWD